MRFTLRLSPNTKEVPFDHLHNLTGRIHTWLGPNDLHDGTSLYSFSWLRGAKPRKGGLMFPGGAEWTISFSDPEAVRKLMEGIRADQEVAFGMRVYEVQEQAPPSLGSPMSFLVSGPVVLRAERDDGSDEYLLWEDDRADDALTRIFRWKLQLAGLEGEHLESTMRFDRTYARPRSKLVRIKGIAHKGSECPVIVEGTPQAAHFAWLVGAGELTGSGCGGLK
jgi:CRISPR-associated endoribonuclease Cas6